jgi:nucleoside-diphosphate kinase
LTRPDERTLVFIKPDAVARGLMGEILRRIERRGFSIVAVKLLKMTRRQAEELYRVHADKPFFGRLVKHVTSGPILAFVVEGPGCVESIRNLIGRTDPTEAGAGTVRGDLGLTKTYNSVHASDSRGTAEREIPIFFREKEVLRYTRPLEGSYFKAN